MAMIETPMGRIAEHLVGDMAVFGDTASRLDHDEGSMLEDASTVARLEADARIVSGRLVQDSVLAAEGLAGHLAAAGTYSQVA